MVVYLLFNTTVGLRLAKTVCMEDRLLYDWRLLTDRAMGSILETPIIQQSSSGRLSIRRLEVSFSRQAFQHRLVTALQLSDRNATLHQDPTVTMSRP